MFIMLLNDGETYTNVEGCKVVTLSDDYEAGNDIKYALADGTAQVVATFHENDHSWFATPEVGQSNK